MKYLITISLFFAFSCIDRISFYPGVQEEYLVVYGQFSAYQKDHELTIMKTKAFGTDGEPVSDATVWVFDEEGNGGQYVLFEQGKYILPKDDPFLGKVGGDYHIEISLENGKKYRSQAQELEESLLIEEVNFELYFREEVTSANSVISRPYLRILVDAQTKNTNGQGTYLRWIVREEYAFTDTQCHPLDNRVTCYFKLPVEVRNYPIFESVSTQQDQISNLQVFERDLTPDWQFNERHMFSVHQYSMSEESYRYWEKVNIVTGQTGSIFDKQAASIPGNIYSLSDPDEEVFGYFEVVGESVNRVYTLKEFLEPLQIIPACQNFFTNFRNEQSFCCFCWLIDGEQIPRPDYWGDD